MLAVNMAIFLSGNMIGNMSMIYKTADQLKLVGYRFVCRLQAAPRLTTT